MTSIANEIVGLRAIQADELDQIAGGGLLEDFAVNVQGTKPPPPVAQGGGLLGSFARDVLGCGRLSRPWFRIIYALR